MRLDLKKNLKKSNTPYNILKTDVNKELEYMSVGAEGSVIKVVDGNPTYNILNKTDVGLNLVDNTSDVNKPISNLTKTALESKFDINNTVFISPLRIDRLLKPVIIAGQPTTFVAENVAQISQATASESGFLSVTDWNTFNSKLSTSEAANTYAPITSPTFTGTVSGITNAMVGLGNVDNTSDLNKPISAATQDALNSKLDTLTAKSDYAQLAKNNIFTGSNTFANTTSSNAYSKITGEWNGGVNNNIASFMLKYETKFGGNIISRTPLTFDYNGWVGIGKESPTVPLDVSGSGKFSSDLSTFTLGSSSKTILAANEGNVGIGIGTPTEKLDVVGNIKASGTILGSNLSGTNTGDNAVNSLYSGLDASKLDVVAATNTYMPLSGGTFVGNVNYSPLFSQSINADASSTEYQRFKWYVYNPNGNTTAGAESKLVLQTIRRSGAIGIKNNIVVDNGKVGINIVDLDNEPSKSLTVGGDMKITGQPFVNTSLFDYNEGNYLKVASGGGIIGENLDLKFLTNNNAIANYARLGSNNSFSGQNTFLNPVLATSIAASGAVSALSFSSTTGANFATSSGNVGIGTVIDAGFKLDVNGTGRFTGNVNFNSTVGIGTPAIAERTLLVTTSTTDVNFESRISRITGNNYAIIGGAIGVGATLNQGGFFYASGGASNYGVRINNVLETADNWALLSDSPAKSYFQGNLGIGTAYPLATLDVNGYTKLKAYTTAEINAIASPTQGIIAYNSTIATLCFYDGISWKRVLHLDM